MREWLKRLISGTPKLDTDNDFIADSRYANLNPTAKGFRDWLIKNSEHSLNIIDAAFKIPDNKLRDVLYARHFDEYLDELEFAYNSRNEQC